jgi:hypothetical protein
MEAIPMDESKNNKVGYVQNPMLNLLEATVRPLMLNSQVLDVAYELYLSAPPSVYPVINLKELALKTGASLLECRNAIVKANQHGRFPQCALET